MGVFLGCRHWQLHPFAKQVANCHRIELNVLLASLAGAWAMFYDECFKAQETMFNGPLSYEQLSEFCNNMPNGPWYVV